MKYFKLFIFLLVFCLTGCDVTYNLTITNDNMIESVNFWYSDNEANRQLLDQYLSVSHQAYFDMDTSLTHNYNQSKMSKDDKIGMNLNYSYENDDLQKSSLLSRCYYKKNVINTDTQIVINTEGPISCMYMDGVKEFDSLEINIITKLKVLENNADKVTRCPNRHCGYPVSAGMKVCPVCHTPIGRPDSPDGNSGNGGPADRPSGNASTPKADTINPWAKPTKDSFCTLQRIPWEDEMANYAPINYPGEIIALTRANTDANNNTITSKTQAVLTLENGEWFIENKSQLQTTLLRVDRKMKLEDGDVIVLGNRMFKFKKG